MPKQKRCSRSSQLDRALLALRELILGGTFAERQRVPEIPLALQLGVSRTPLRLALEQLAHEGIVEASNSGGFLARHFSIRDINDAIGLRGVLEGHAARLAAERLHSAEELAPMNRYTAQMSELVGSGQIPHDFLVDYVEFNAAFHSELIELSKSPMLRRSFEHVISLPFASPSAFVQVQAHLDESRKILIVAQEQHRAIVEAIAERDAGRAENLAREHARLARRNLEIALRDRSLLHLVPGGCLIELTSDPKRRVRSKAKRAIHAL